MRTKAVGTMPTRTAMHLWSMMRTLPGSVGAASRQGADKAELKSPGLIDAFFEWNVADFGVR